MCESPGVALVGDVNTWNKLMPSLRTQATHSMEIGEVIRFLFSPITKGSRNPGTFAHWLVKP